MALLASLGEVSTDVTRAGRSLVVLQVAGHARCRIQAVVIIDVAISTGSRRYSVQPCKREAGTGVIECRIHPVAGVVALVASLREIRRNVIGIRRSLVILEVATDAGRCIQRVVIVDVAVGAGTWRHSVQTGQRKAGC